MILVPACCGTLIRSNSGAVKLMAELRLSITANTL